MPALWMHLEYGQRLAAEFRDRLSFLSEFPAKRNLYHAGCLGPDVLLFHRFWSWRVPSRAVRLGNLMHSRNCGPVLVDVFSQSLMLPSPIARRPCYISSVFSPTICSIAICTPTSTGTPVTKEWTISASNLPWTPHFCGNSSMRTFRACPGGKKST